MYVLPEATRIGIPSLADSCLDTVGQFTRPWEERVAVDQPIGSYSECVDVTTNRRLVAVQDLRRKMSNITLWRGDALCVDACGKAKIRYLGVTIAD